MIIPTKLSPEEQIINNKVWNLRLKYDTFNAFTEKIDSKIYNCSVEEFKKITQQFETPSDYAMALANMTEYIETGNDVPSELYIKIQQTRQDFQKRLV